MANQNPKESETVNIPPWFRIKSDSRRTYKATPDANLGAAFKAALEYLETLGQDESIAAGITDTVTKIAFETFLTGIDETLIAYQKQIEGAKRRQEERKKKKAEEETQKAALEKYGTPEPQPQQSQFEKVPKGA